MTVLVDSWAWLEYFFGSAAGEKAGKIIEDERQRKIVSKINLFEVYCKSLKNEGAAMAQKRLSFVLQTCEPKDISVEIAKLAAEIKLEEKLGMADALILATAAENDAIILTGDKHFAKTDRAKVQML